MAIPGVAIRGQRSLLRQIREALAGGGPAQQRLDMVVRDIARSIVAGVCSRYLRRAIGVLVVQNRTARVYTDDEVEDLQIVAMVLAEMVAAGELIGGAELKGVEIAPNKPERLKGSKFGDGLAYGVAVLHEQPVASS